MPSSSILLYFQPSYLLTTYLLTTRCSLLTAHYFLTKAGFAFKLPRRASEDRGERYSGGDVTVDPRPAAALSMPAALLEFIAKHELAGDAAQELTAIWTKSVTTAGSGGAAGLRSGTLRPRPRQSPPQWSARPFPGGPGAKTLTPERRTTRPGASGRHSLREPPERPATLPPTHPSGSPYRRSTLCAAPPTPASLPPTQRPAPSHARPSPPSPHLHYTSSAVDTHALG